MLKLFAILALAAVVSANVVPNTCEAEKETIHQLAMILPGARADCGFTDGLWCVGEIGAVIAECVATGWTGVGLVGCVTGVIGAASDCFNCVCWVIEYLGFSCS